MHYLLPLLAMVCLIASGCEDASATSTTSRSDEKIVPFDSIFSPFGLFGVGIGDGPDAVKSSLGAPDQQLESEMVYESPYPSMKSTLYVNVDKKEVYELTLDLFPADSVTTARTFAKLIEAMDNRFHESRPAEGYATWETSSPAGHLIEVSLTDESLEHGSPLIMLNFIENYDRTYKQR